VGTEKPNQDAITTESAENVESAENAENAESAEKKVPVLH